MWSLTRIGAAATLVAAGAGGSLLTRDRKTASTSQPPSRHEQIADAFSTSGYAGDDRAALIRTARQSARSGADVRRIAESFATSAYAGDDKSRLALAALDSRLGVDEIEDIARRSASSAVDAENRAALAFEALEG